MTKYVVKNRAYIGIETSGRRQKNSTPSLYLRLSSHASFPAKIVGLPRTPRWACLNRFEYALRDSVGAFETIYSDHDDVQEA